MIQTAFAAARMAVGFSIIAAPRHIATAFLLPFSPETALAARLAGARDLAIGALLYTCRSSSASHNNADANQAGENTTLLAKNTQSQLGHVGWSETQRALMAGFVVDGIDVLSTLVCYLEGNLPLEGALVFGGGAVAFLVLGAYCWYREARRGL